MFNLAIECSGFGGSVALFHGERQLDFQVLPEHLSSVQSLAATIRSILLTAAIGQPDLISVTCGPGSFTGLRVGLATAKTMALAWQIPIAGVDSLAVISGHASEHLGTCANSPTHCVAVINAFRKQVFAGAWEVGGLSSQPLATSQVVDAAEWSLQPLKSLEFDRNPLHSPPHQIVVSGPGLATYTPAESPSVCVLPQAVWAPRAIEVAKLGWQIYQRGEAVSAIELTPNYVRASAAEDQAHGT